MSYGFVKAIATIIAIILTLTVIFAPIGIMMIQLNCIMELLENKAK